MFGLVQRLLGRVVDSPIALYSEAEQQLLDWRPLLLPRQAKPRWKRRVLFSPLPGAYSIPALKKKISWRSPAIRGFNVFAYGVFSLLWHYFLLP